MMRAVMADTHGGLDCLALGSAPIPSPAEGMVRIRVAACGLNFADLLMVKGTYQQTPPLPFSPGAEVCGTVDALGSGVDDRWLGKRIVAYCGHGGLAEYVTARVDACAFAPDALTDQAVATLPVAYGSSELALARRARLQAGETLVVAGAGGGVGLTAVEIGYLMGARVIAIARGKAKADAARAVGADELIDPDDFDLETPALRDCIREMTGGNGADVVYDPVGGSLGTALMRATAFEARYMPIGFASGEVLPLKANHLLVKNIDVIGFWWGAYFDRAPAAMADSFSRLLTWAAEGRIAPHISDVLPLERSVEALQLIKDRSATGKVVVTTQS